MNSSISRLIVIALVALSAAACGKAPEEVAKGPPPMKGIFVSTNDCAAANKIPLEACGEAIDMALQTHEKTVKSYPTIGQCAKAEGENRCDRSVDGQYRPRLQAYLVTLSVPPISEPLYPGAKKTVGFRSSKKTVVEAIDDTMIVSASAMSLAHENSRTP